MNTEIQLPVAELKSILPGLNKVISKRSTLPVLGCVRIERSNKGEITLQGTDLDDHVTVSLKDAQPGESTAVLIPWEPLSKAIKGSNNKETVVLVNDKQGARLRTFAGGSPIEQKLESVDLKEWPPIPQVNKPGITLTQDLRQALQQALECASEEETRRNICGAYLDVVDPKAHYVVGTNGRVVFSANSFNLNLKASVLIPNRKFLHWEGFLGDSDCSLSTEPAIEIGRNKRSGWVQLKNDKWTFVTKQIEGNYPNWKQVVSTDKPRAKVTLDEGAVKSLLEIIPKLPGEEIMNSPVTLVVKPSQLTVQARAKDQEKPATVIIHGASITGQSITVGVNRHYLVRALEYGLNEIHLFQPTSPLVCLDKGRRLIIAPLAPEVETTAAAPTPSSAAAPAASPIEPTETVETNNEGNTMRRNTTAVIPPVTEEAPASESAIKAVIEQVEGIKETLKGVLGQFSDVLASLKLAEKEKKVSEKEIESVRSTLRTIQNVKI